MLRRYGNCGLSIEWIIYQYPYFIRAQIRALICMQNWDSHSLRREADLWFKVSVRRHAWDSWVTLYAEEAVTLNCSPDAFFMFQTNSILVRYITVIL